MARVEAAELAGSRLFKLEDMTIQRMDNVAIVVDGGWFSCAPYLANERSHHMLSILDKKEHLEEMIHRFH